MDVYGGSNCIELNLNDVDPVLRGLSQTETNINLVRNLVAMYTVSVKLLFLHSRGHIPHYIILLL